MRKMPWLRVFLGGVVVSIGSLHGFAWSESTDDAPAAKSNDSKSAAKAKRKGSKKNPNAAQPTNESEAATPKENEEVSKPKAEAPPSEYALTTALLGNLSPEHMKSLGQMLEQDWKDRPEWGEMAIAIMKNDAMRPGTGWWKPGAKRYDWNWLAERLDANKDGKIEHDEFPSELAKADQLFERLDKDGDGKLTAADFDDSDPAAMDLAAMKNKMSNQLFSRLDKDSNGRVTMDELADFFRYGDKEGLEFLTPEDLRFAIDAPPAKKREAPHEDNPAASGPSTPANALRLFLRGDLGWLTAGPQLNDPAPEFTLPTHDGTAKVKLSDSFGKRPVVLVFGSFT